MATQYTEEFKIEAVRYWKKHPEIGIDKCAKNLDISKTALSNWPKIYETNEVSVLILVKNNRGYKKETPINGWF